MGFVIRRLIFMVAPVLWRKFQQRRRSRGETGEGSAPESSPPKEKKDQ